MRPLIYDIFFRGNAWHFVCDDVTSAPFQTQAAARRAAEMFAMENGSVARVRIYRFDGILQEERSYDRRLADASNHQRPR